MRKLMLGITGMACACALAETRTWTGSDGDWNNAANWSPAGVPAAGDTAVFNANAAISSAWTLPGDLTLSVAKGATVDFNGAIAGAADADLTVTTAATDGAGTVNFRASSTFAGSLLIRKGNVYGYADDAFGLATDDVPMVDLEARDKFTKLYLKGIRNLKRIYQRPWDPQTGHTSTVLFDGYNTLGKFQTQSTARSKVNSGTTVVTRGISNSGIWLAFVAKGSEMIVSNTPTANLQYYAEGGPGTLVFACTGNKFTAGSEIVMPYRCDVNGALDPSADLAFGSSNDYYANPMLDLNGTTQRVTRLYSKKAYTHNGTVTSAEPGLVTVADKADFENRMAFTGQASLELALAAGKTATLFGQSTSTGDLILTSGACVIDAAGTWSGDVHVKAGTSLRLGSTGGLGAGGTTLHLEGGTLELPAGTAVVRAIVDVDGATHTSGFFAATAKGGATALAGLAGEGFIQVIPATPPVPASWTWTGAAGDGKFSTPGNWRDDDGIAGTADHAPDFASAGNAFHFPATATIAVDAPVSAAKLLFDGEEAATVTFVGTEGGYSLAQFGGAFEITGADKTVAFDAPYRFSGTVSAVVDPNSTLTFTGHMTTMGSASFVKRGYGVVKVVGDANNVVGTFESSNGVLRVAGRDPFGPNCKLRNYQENADSKSYVWLENARVTGPFINQAWGSIGNGQTCLYGAPGTTNVILGKTTNVNGHFRWRAEDKAELTLAGGVSSGNFLMPQGADGAVCRIAETPVNIGSQFYFDYNTLTVCAFAVPGNSFGGMLITSTVRTEVDNAFVADTKFNFAKDYGRIDLWGTTQRVENAYVSHHTKDADGHVTKLTGETSAYGGTAEGVCAGNIKSDRPGAYIAFTGSTTYPRTPVFGGAVSFERAGTGTTTFYEANAATGEVVVTGGTLRFAAPGATWYYQGVAQTYRSTGGSWAGLLATVEGGTLALDHGAAFPKDVDFRLCGGALQLGAGVAQRANSLSFLRDGEWVKAPAGTWGAFDNMSVAPERRTMFITGPGVLSVTATGTVILFR